MGVCQRKKIVVICSSERLTLVSLSTYMLRKREQRKGKVSLTIRLPLDLVYFVNRLLVCDAEDLLPIQSVDMNVLVNRRQCNQVYSRAVCQMLGIDCRLHQLLGQRISHAERTTADCVRSPIDASIITSWLGEQPA